MVGARSDVLDPVFFHLPLEAGLSSPVGVLPAVVGEHLTRHTVLGSPPPVGLQYMFGGLAAVKTKAGDVTRVVVYKADQVGILTSQPKGHDVALPQLVRSGSFKKASVLSDSLPAWIWPFSSTPRLKAFCARWWRWHSPEKSA